METPESKNPSLDGSADLQQLRIDYAWKWFNFHAEQRTKMFNFMLIGLGIFASGLVTAIDKKLLLEAALLSTAAMALAIGFRLIDKRNRQLYKAAEDVLINAEKKVLFGENIKISGGDGELVPFAIANRIAIEDKDADLKGPLTRIFQGRHRDVMPAIAWGFAALFLFLAAGLWREWWLGAPATPVTQVLCCQAGSTSGTTTPLGTSTEMPFSSTPDVIAIDGIGSISGVHWFLVIAGLVIAAGGAVAFFTGHKKLGVMAVAGGVATSVLPNLSIPLTGQFHFDPKIEAKLAEKIDLRIERLISIIRRAEPAMLASGRFGGFGDGVESFDCKEIANQQTVTAVNAGIVSTRERQLQAVVLLVGGTDRKPLSQPLRRRFESNAGLARARVNAVERCLDLAPAQGQGPAQPPPEVIRLITGPAYTPGSTEADDVASKKMAEDREVRAFVIGVPTRKP